MRGDSDETTDRRGDVRGGKEWHSFAKEAPADDQAFQEALARFKKSEKLKREQNKRFYTATEPPGAATRLADVFQLMRAVGGIGREQLCILEQELRGLALRLYFI